MSIPVSEDGAPLRGALDSSTAIILYKSGLLESFCAEWDLITTDAVYEEISQGISGKEISCILKSSSDSDAVSIEGLFGKGENSVLNLYREGKAGIIFSDDGRFLEYCKKEGIPHYSSIMVPYLLFNIGKMSKDKGLEYTSIIITKGRFSEWVLDYVKSLWEKKISHRDTENTEKG